MRVKALGLFLLLKYSAYIMLIAIYTVGLEGRCLALQFHRGVKQLIADGRKNLCFDFYGIHTVI